MIMERLRRFMYGRYGMDKLGIALIVLSMAVALISNFFGNGLVGILIYVVAYIPIVFAVLRFISKDITARRRENAIFVGFFNRVVKWFKLQFNRIRDFRTHKYFTCPGCKNALRVPRGKGNITITCPVCRTKFDRKS